MTLERMQEIKKELELVKDKIDVEIAWELFHEIELSLENQCEHE